MKNTCDLAQKHCIPCEGGIAPLAGKELAELKNQLGESWLMISNHHLQKEFVFKNFVQALAFTNKVGDLAEQEGHHPDILLTYGKVRIELSTHKIDGLSESDFILAAKIDGI